MLRAVLDANLVVSALIHPVGPPGRVLARYLRRGEFQAVLSLPILDEIRASLQYPKVRRYIRFSNEQIELFLVAIEILANRVEPVPVPGSVPADPDDEIYLAAAVGGWRNARRERRPAPPRPRGVPGDRDTASASVPGSVGSEQMEGQCRACLLVRSCFPRSGE